MTATRNISLYIPGGALKAFEYGKIGGYLVVFTGPNDRDSYNEYFTRGTDYGLDWYKNQPVLYHHGQNDQMVTPIGIITELRVDDYGVYADAVLDVNHENPDIRNYARTAYTEVNAGALFWSSGSASHIVRVSSDGEILQWPIVEGSLTPKPAEQQGRTYVEVIRAALSAHEVLLDTLTKEPAQAKESTMNRSTTHRRLRMTQTAKMDSAQMLAALDNVAALDDATKLAVMRELAALESGMAETETMAEEDMEVPPAADMPPNLPAEPIAAAPRSQVSPKEIAAQIAQRLQYMRTAPAQAPVQPQLPAGGGVNPAAPKAANITMRTPYHDLSEVDMSYMYELRSGMARNGKSQKPDVKFIREMHEKVKRTLTYDSSASTLKMAPQDANRILAIKDNELDNTASAGQILEWIPTVWSSELWRRVRLENEVASSFRTVDMPSDPYNLPIESTDPTVYLVPETTNEAQLTLASSANPIPDSVLGSGKVTLDAKKLALRVGFSSEAEEDSIIPFIPQLREQGIRAMANAVDNVLLNGDTTTTASTNINDIAGTPAATDKFLIFNGLLKNALVTTSGQTVNLGNSAPTLASIRLLRSKLQSALNVYGLRPDDLVMFVDPYTWFKMLSIDEINAWLNNGRNATVNSGMLPNIDGIPVWPSQELALANSAGKIDQDTPANNAYGRIVMAAKTGWTIGYRRQVTTNIDYLSYYDSYQMTATLRIAFINKDGYASAAAFGVNVS